MLESRKEPDGTTTFYFDTGEKLPRGFTPQTDAAPIAKFLTLCRVHEQELLSMVREYRERLEWNHAAPQGRDWPIFRRMEKFLNRLQKQAGIIDS